jgi:hypothetical protein
LTNIMQASNLVEMRSSKPRTVLDLLLCPWHMPASGKTIIFLLQSLVIDRFYRFAEAVIKAAKGEKGIVEPTFVYLPGVTGGDEIAKATGVEFFSTPVELGVSTTFQEY